MNLAPLCTLWLAIGGGKGFSSIPTARNLWACRRGCMPNILPEHSEA